ncbi:MAG TPA: phenylalanine--tRNA ligase subunit beta, partial [Flavisolibacter sp.]|nr:phenylalanine--tRNA ligase subunit beta [Flavisolibacter sp.]
MTISYNWLNEYLPVSIEAERLGRILTSIGLEVEKMEVFEEVKGGLKGLQIAEVLDVQQHPNADKLKLTKVKTGNELLQIVCGAPNVAAGQKVIVAPVGTTIYPAKGDPLTMKVAKIRGVESFGMICAEDEIGLGNSHAGIMVLPEDAKVGMSAVEYFAPYSDIIYEIGLTPNRMDAMSHWGVARDVCAYLSHHDKKDVRPVLPATQFKVDTEKLDITVTVEDTDACKRYSGVCISEIKVGESPKWLQQRLKAIGVRPINNIVDVTNYIQHETGQPLHAFDYNGISGQTIIVKKLKDGTPFVTLDEKERKLSSEDLMICDSKGPMCIAGVFGGLKSGVTDKTTTIFLESAYFDPINIRKTSFRHGLRTDAATRFEKGIDISATVSILKRAAMLIKQVAGGEIASEVLDVYPSPPSKAEVALKYHYLKQLSGKIYHPDTIKNILESLDFTVVREGLDVMVLQVPYHKPDVTLPADIVEEILRIDGLDSIEIPSAITITPSIEENLKEHQLKEKLSSVLTGMGFSEILTNSITNSAYLNQHDQGSVVKLLNNLSSELDVLRPSMLYTALEVIAFNLNRKSKNIKLFEFGKTYSSTTVGSYQEKNHLALYTTGALNENHWKQQTRTADYYYLKGIAESILSTVAITIDSYETFQSPEFEYAVKVVSNKEEILTVGVISKNFASRFDVKQSVIYADFNWDKLVASSNTNSKFKEIPKYPPVERDLAIIVEKAIKYEQVKDQLIKLRLNKLKDVRLFDLFESEKIGQDKKSLAINFTFLDEEKTLTDK